MTRRTVARKLLMNDAMVAMSHSFTLVSKRAIMATIPMRL